MRFCMRYDLAEHGAFLSYFLSQSPGVYAGYAGDGVFFQPFVETFFRIPMIEICRVFGNDESSYVNIIAFEFGVRDAVIPDKRVCQSEDLASVRRVGKTFRISHHARVENDFTFGISCRTE